MSRKRKSYDEYMKEFEQLAYYKLTVYENNEFLFTKYFHMFDKEVTKWMLQQMGKGRTIKSKELQKGLKNKIGKCFYRESKYEKIRKKMLQSAIETTDEVEV